MNRVFLQSGSNLGNRKVYLEYAILEIQKISNISSISSIYESQAWGYQSEKAFYNQCIEIQTGLNPMDLLGFIKEAEKKAGRRKSGKDYQDRELDIDILFYGNKIMKTTELEIPHPRLHLRAFTLKPMVEIAPQFIHPVFNESMEVLLEKCPDRSNPGIVY